MKKILVVIGLVVKIFVCVADSGIKITWIIS